MLGMVIMFFEASVHGQEIGREYILFSVTNHSF